jgi:hypothetical protein
MKTVDKINDDLQEKQRQLIDMCKHFSENKTVLVDETKIDTQPKMFNFNLKFSNANWNA